MHPCWIHPLLIFCKAPQLVPLREIMPIFIHEVFLSRTHVFTNKQIQKTNIFFDYKNWILYLCPLNQRKHT